MSKSYYEIRTEELQTLIAIFEVDTKCKTAAMLTRKRLMKMQLQESIKKKK